MGSIWESSLTCHLYPDVCTGSGYYYWWFFLCPLNPRLPGIWHQVRSGGQRLLSQQAFLSTATASSYTIMKLKPLCHAGRIDLWPSYFYLQKSVFNFFFFFYHLSHESTATGFLDCSSVGPLGSIWLHRARVPLSAFGGFSHRLYVRGQHGEWRGGWGVVHIQGCTLMVTVVFPSKCFICCWHTVLSSVFNFTAQTAIPIASTELWPIKHCLHQTCFCIHKLIWSTFFW